MVDVIIPAFNAHDTIFKTLCSIASQINVEQIEVTIVDDFSDLPYDYLIDMFSSLFKINVIRCEQNGGPGYARRIGIEKTKNPYICFIDADDIFSDSFGIKKLFDIMQSNEKIYLASAGFLEEHESFLFVSHENDLTWVFGKMYRRTYLENHNINFNDTRCNEDAGFNTKLRCVAKNDDILYFLSDVIYVWKCNPNSITRINNFEYGYNTGFQGFVFNKLEALKINNANPYFVERHTIEVLIECYRTYVQATVERPEFMENIITYSKKYWDEIGKSYYENMNSDELNLILVSSFNLYPLLVIPTITFYDFIKLLY